MRLHVRGVLPVAGACCGADVLLARESTVGAQTCPPPEPPSLWRFGFTVCGCEASLIKFGICYLRFCQLSPLLAPKREPKPRGADPMSPLRTVTRRRSMPPPVVLGNSLMRMPRLRGFCIKLCPTTHESTHFSENRIRFLSKTQWVVADSTSPKASEARKPRTPGFLAGACGPNVPEM